VPSSTTYYFIPSPKVERKKEKGKRKVRGGEEKKREVLSPSIPYVTRLSSTSFSLRRKGGGRGRDGGRKEKAACRCSFHPVPFPYHFSSGEREKKGEEGGRRKKEGKRKARLVCIVGVFFLSAAGGGERREG